MLGFHAASLSLRLKRIDLTIGAGQWWTLLGPNGAGKSSLLNLAAGLEHPCEGEVMLNDAPLGKISFARLSEFRCLASQFYRSEFKISVKETLQFFTEYSTVPSLIESHINIECLLGKIVETLSGGEKQRVHLARNLMQIWPSIEKGSALILLDEPLQQMDVSYQVKALKLISTLHSLGNTIIMSHHDINQTLQYSTHACLLQNGEALGAGTIGDMITLQSMQALYAHPFKVIKDAQTNQAYFITD